MVETLAFLDLPNNISACYSPARQEMPTSWHSILAIMCVSRGAQPMFTATTLSTLTSINIDKPSCVSAVPFPGQLSTTLSRLTKGYLGLVDRHAVQKVGPSGV